MQLDVHTRDVFLHVPFIHSPGKFSTVLWCDSIIFKICVSYMHCSIGPWFNIRFIYLH